MDIVQWLAIAASTAIFGTVAALIARRRLKPRYALVWLVASLAILVPSFWRDVIDTAAAAADVHYAPALVFLALHAFSLLVLLHLSVAVSGLEDRVRTLLEEVAVLRHERSSAPGSSTPAPPGEPA